MNEYTKQAVVQAMMARHEMTKDEAESAFDILVEEGDLTEQDDGTYASEMSMRELVAED